MSATLDRVIISGLLAVVLFTALAQGAVEGWSVAIFEWTIAALVLLWGLKMGLSGKLRILVPAPTFPIAALLVFGVIQGLVFNGRGGHHFSLSMDAESTRQGVAVLFFLLAAFLIAVNVFSSRDRLQRLAAFLVAYGLAMSVFALIQYFTWNGKFYWLIPTRGGAAFGPFVNRNHFAGYMEMLMPIPIGLLVCGAADKQRIIYGFAAVMMGIAVLAAQSRGALLAVVCEMILIAVVDRWFAKVRRVRDRANGLVPETRGLVLRLGAVGIISVAILAGILWIGADPIIGRVAGSSLSKGQAPDPGYSRHLIWTGTIGMIKANPLIGVGFGAYETAYPIYAVTDGTVIVGQSHNDYLQIVADCGVVGGILTIWFLIVMARSTMRALAARDRLLSGLALGCGAGVLGLLVHSLVDFNLQLPSNALLFLLLSAVVSVIAAIKVPSPRPAAATGSD
jgi:O-antigen ligase